MSRLSDNSDYCLICGTRARTRNCSTNRRLSAGERCRHDGASRNKVVAFSHCTIDRGSRSPVQAARVPAIAAAAARSAATAAPRWVASPSPARWAPRCSRRRTALRSADRPSTDVTGASTISGNERTGSSGWGRDPHQLTQRGIDTHQHQAQQHLVAAGEVAVQVDRDTPASSATSAIRIWELPRRTMQRPAASSSSLRASSSSRIARSSPHRRLGSMPRSMLRDA